MTSISLTCSGCRRALCIPVEDDEGPWSDEDVASLDRATSEAGWTYRLPYDTEAYVYCPEHTP
jgi:cation transport regulator ChaC